MSLLWFPGVLSQGGKKFTWGRYALKAAPVERFYTTNKTELRYSTAYTKGYVFHEDTGLFDLDAASYQQTTWETVAAMPIGSVLYSTQRNFGLFYTSSLTGHATIYKGVYVGETTYNGEQAAEIDIYTLTAGNVRGEYIDTVEASATDAYPDNGQQGDYWYVRYSDTPITWERYAVSQTAVEGSSTRATGVYNKYLKVGTEYSIENGEFAVTTTQSLRIRSSTSSFSAPYTILAGGTLSLQSSSQTTGGTVRGPMLGKLTRIAGSSSNMYADFIPYTIGTSKGSYIDTVESFVPDEYPDDGIQDGYWYVKIS